MLRVPWKDEVEDKDGQTLAKALYTQCEIGEEANLRVLVHVLQIHQIGVGEGGGGFGCTMKSL